MSEEPGERRQEVLRQLSEASERITRLETFREADREFARLHLTTLKDMVSEMSEVKLAVNTIRTERNTLIAIAGLMGAVLTWVGKGVVAFMTSGGMK